MKYRILAIIFCVVLSVHTQAQRYDYELQGEFGFTAGAAHYFGDLNPKTKINRPKPALGLFYRKQFGNYIGLRTSFHYAQIGYSDKYYSSNEFQRERNLSFNSNIWELAVQGDFNFFKFIPGDAGHQFTPYVTIGAGVFNYDPYTYINGQKVMLRLLGTEGQNVGYASRKPYGTMALCMPIGVGVKYNINDKFNINFEIVQRLTTTDYLDDVSKTYAGAASFPLLPNGQPSTAYLLQDRSYEIVPNNVLGVTGRQRGWSKQKDSYLIAEIGISYNISNYKCPTTE